MREFFKVVKFRTKLALLASVLCIASISSSNYAFAKTNNSEINEATYKPTQWTREHISKLELKKNLTSPQIDLTKLKKLSNEDYLWDNWVLMNENGTIAKVNGWRILFVLSSPIGDLRTMDNPKIMYFYSKDGKNWTKGGYLFPEGSGISSKEWSGSAIVDKKGKLRVFYTAAEGYQRLATASATIVTSKTDVKFINWSKHKVLLEADGKMYEKQEKGYTYGRLNAFRDPMFFRDPKTKKSYLLFSANTGPKYGSRGTLASSYIGSSSFFYKNPVPNSDLVANACIAIAEFKDNSLSSVKMLPPLLAANAVNDELERPNIIVKNGKYYLFTTSRASKFAPNVIKNQEFKDKEALYGFMANTLFGNYSPLNKSGLVIGNPHGYDHQAYAWLVLPNLNVIGFAGDVLNEENKVVYAPAQAPTIKISINGSTTKVEKELDVVQIE